MFSTGFFSLVDTVKSNTATKDYQTASANDSSGYQFDYAYLASGNANSLTFKPAVNGTVTIYLTLSDGNFSSKLVEKSSGSLTLKKDTSDAETVLDASATKTSTATAYAITFDAIKNTEYVLTTVSVRTALFGVTFATSAEEPTD